LQSFTPNPYNGPTNVPGGFNRPGDGPGHQSGHFQLGEPLSTPIPGCNPRVAANHPMYHHSHSEQMTSPSYAHNQRLTFPPYSNEVR